MVLQVGLEILAQLVDLADAHPRRLARAKAGADTREQGIDEPLIKAAVVFPLRLAVEHMGVGEDLEDVDLAQHLEHHWVTRRGWVFVGLDGEARDQPGGLLAAGGVDACAVVEAGEVPGRFEHHLGGAVCGGDHLAGHERLARLAGAEDGDRHGPARGAREFAGLEAEFAQAAGVFGGLGSGRLGVAVEPRQRVHGPGLEEVTRAGELLVFVSIHVQSMPGCQVSRIPVSSQ